MKLCYYLDGPLRQSDLNIASPVQGQHKSRCRRRVRAHAIQVRYNWKNHFPG